MPALRPRRWTTADVDRLIHERKGSSPRFELVDGELLVTPAPSGRHQRIVLSLARVLQTYLSREQLGEVRLGPAALRLETDSYVEPDLVVLPSADGRLPRADDPSIRPLLICEVLSPSSSRHDRITKRRVFQGQAVPDYWVIDGDAEAFEIWHPGDDRAALVDGRLLWRPASTLVPFELDVRAFFAATADGAPLP